MEIKWTAPSEFGTYRLCEQRRFRRACASAQFRQNLRCSLIQAVNQEELSDRKPDPWPLWMAGHAQLKFVMTECLKTQIRLTGSNVNVEMQLLLSSNAVPNFQLSVWLFAHCSHYFSVYSTKSSRHFTTIALFKAMSSFCLYKSMTNNTL